MSEVSKTAENALNGNLSNLIVISVFAIIIIALIVVLIKTGLLKFKGNGFQVGHDDKTREILRRQIEYADVSCKIFTDKLIASMPHIIEICEQFLLRYLNEKIYNEVVHWIVINHIAVDEFYIKNKQMIMYSIITEVLSINNLASDFSDEFKKLIDSESDLIIRNLVNIRDYYTKEN